MSLPQEQFRVSLDAFDGPLDLLLYLVQRVEVDIHDIPIAQITDEYLDILRLGISIDVDMAGEFLVMAATLIEIKSRSLVPADQAVKDDAELDKHGALEDPRGDLIRQLLSFQRFRIASDLLENRRVAFARRFEASVAIEQLPRNNEPALELDDIHVLDLTDAYEHIASSIDFSKLGDHHITFDDISIELCQKDLVDRLHRANLKQLTFQSTFVGLSLSERVGMFLATLELVRLRIVSVQQELHDGDIIIELLEEDPTMFDESNAEES